MQFPGQVLPLIRQIEVLVHHPDRIRLPDADSGQLPLDVPICRV